MTCDHYKKPCPFAGGAEDGAWVCFHCSKNTAKGMWPAKDSLPKIQAITINGHLVKPTAPVPREQWPAWARWVAFRAKKGDAGVGDTVARELRLPGDLFKAAMRTMGADCGCNARQQVWNQKYPYPVLTP